MKDWTQGSIVGNLLRLSWPMVISNSLMMLGPTIDVIWVGRLGSASIAGVGVAGIATQLVIGAIMGLIMGMRALIARFVGSGDVRGANHVAQQALVISGGFAILMAAVGVFLTEEILGLFGLEADVVAAGSAYLRIMFIGTAAISFRIMAEGTMQASGDTVTPMSISVIFRLFHVTLCPFLVFGWWIFPEMGVKGAAMTNVISQSLGVALGMICLFTGRSVYFEKTGFLPVLRLGPSRMRLTLRNFQLDFNIIRRIARIGMPAMVSGTERTFSQFFLMYFMAPFGTAAVAAHTIIQRVEMVLFMPGMAFGNGAGVLVGQNLGAGQPKRAEKSVWMAGAMVGVMLVVCSVVILLFAENIARIFNQEADLVEQAGIFLRIAVVGYMVLPLIVVFMSALSGAGDTLPPMIISTITIWVIQLPMAYFLPIYTDIGVYGVRWAIVAGMVVGAIGYTAYFRTGRWKRRHV
ncbi:MAG TPA: MATE family efflux transporter [Dehalococcoidia bacterium]|nr:MATE family efflux transporter [Dehalococcoidia bacterium]